MKRAAVVIASGLTVLGVVFVGTSGVASAAKPKVPTIKQITPEHGPTSGGTRVEIQGKNLGGITGVSFGGTASTSVTAVSQSEVTAVSPAGTGTVDITATTASGTSVAAAADQFTYVSTPSIENLTPREGTTLGGNTVTIVGSGFAGATAVSFGSIPATRFTVQTDQEIVATSPAEAIGAVDVSVTAPDGVTPSDPAGIFTFSLKVPLVTSVAPDVGPASGGTTVTVTGRRFKNVSAVDFGSTAATSFTEAKNKKSVTVVAPPGVGTVDVTLTNKSGASGATSVDEFTYTGGS